MKLLDRLREKRFRNKLTKEFLMRNMLNALTPEDWHINRKQYTISKNSFIGIYNFEALKHFTTMGGVVLFIEEQDLYKKTKWLKKNNIKYLITEDKKGLKYNKQVINYGH